MNTKPLDAYGFKIMYGFNITFLMTSKQNHAALH